VTLMRCFHLRSRQCSAISARRFLPISPSCGPTGRSALKSGRRWSAAPTR
jgi:hypothetical protein